jgi:hypothetical protein
MKLDGRTEREIEKGEELWLLPLFVLHGVVVKPFNQVVTRVISSAARGASFASRLVPRDVEIGQEDSLEAALLVIVMEEHHRRNAERLLAAATGGDFALKVLNEPICEMVSSPRTARVLHSLQTTVGAGVLDVILEGIAIECGPAG